MSIRWCKLYDTAQPITGANTIRSAVLHGIAVHGVAQFKPLGDITIINMWVKKPPEELKKRQRQKSRILGSLGLGIIIFLGCVFTNGGGIGYALRGTYFKLHLYEIIDSIPIALLIGLIVGLMGYWLLPKETTNQVVFICPKCENTKFYDGNLNCQCGGHFENILTMKWVEKSPPNEI